MSCVCTYLGIFQKRPSWGDEELDTLDTTRQCDATDEQNEQDNVGEDGGEVDHFTGGLDTSSQADKFDGPSQEKAQGQLPDDVAGIVDATGIMKHTISVWIKERRFV